MPQLRIQATKMIVRAAERCGGGGGGGGGGACSVVSVLEGGYSPAMLARCCVEHVRAMISGDGD
jgi:acetoin utilization deacetylase AcuC-like enzyme